MGWKLVQDLVDGSQAAAAAAVAAKALVNGTWTGATAAGLAAGAGGASE